MLSVSRTMDPNEIITILKPRGARIEAPEGETSDVSMPRITIEKVNNGRDYLIDEQKRARFGSIAGSVFWDDVHESDILLAKAKQWLASQKELEKRVNTSIGQLTEDSEVIDSRTDANGVAQAVLSERLDADFKNLAFVRDQSYFLSVAFQKLRSKKEAIKIVVAGDSLTYGFGSNKCRQTFCIA